MTLPYSYETGKTSATVNWKPGAGNGRIVEGITIHHWGSTLRLDFDGIVNFLCSPRPINPTSAHYVTQGRNAFGMPEPRVACIVDPDDIAYACGTWAANLTQISIECRPECSPEDREVVAQLIAKLRAQYGPLPLVGHQHWVPDDCPGSNWMAALPWLDQRADQINAGAAPTPAPAPTSGGLTMADINTLTAQLAALQAGVDKLASQEAGRYSSNFNTDQGRYSSLMGQIAGLSTALTSLSAGKPVDLAAVTAAAKAGAQAALDEKITGADVSLNVTPPAPPAA